MTATREGGAERKNENGDRAAKLVSRNHLLYYHLRMDVIDSDSNQKRATSCGTRRKGNFPLTRWRLSIDVMEAEMVCAALPANHETAETVYVREWAIVAIVDFFISRLGWRKVRNPVIDF
ncbi:MAG: hypothetical protein R3F19_01495 [Verrucomicrobiales bacterium]